MDSSGEVTLIEGAPAGFDAVTVAVNSDGTRLYFGGLVNGGAMFLDYDISTDPMAPVLRGSQKVEGRITSIASGATTIAVVTANDSTIASFAADGVREDVVPGDSSEDVVPGDSSGADQMLPGAVWIGLMVGWITSTL
jgi:hypothetical protein